MQTEERTRFEVLLENIQTSVKVIAEGHSALIERFDRMDVRFDRLEAKVDGLDARVGGLEVRFAGLEARVGGLEVKIGGLETNVGGLQLLATDAQQRLKRIESHLELNGSSRSSPRPHASPRPKATRTTPPKRRPKS